LEASQIGQELGLGKNYERIGQSTANLLTSLGILWIIQTILNWSTETAGWTMAVPLHDTLLLACTIAFTAFLTSARYARFLSDKLSLEQGLKNGISVQELNQISTNPITRWKLKTLLKACTDKAKYDPFGL
jgi:hypothetical protein